MAGVHFAPDDVHAYGSEYSVHAGRLASPLYPSSGPTTLSASVLPMCLTRREEMQAAMAGLGRNKFRTRAIAACLDGPRNALFSWQVLPGSDLLQGSDPSCIS